MKTKKLWMIAVILVICCSVVLTSCDKDDDNTVVQPVKKEYFTLWNQCEALTALQDYVKDVTDPTSANPNLPNCLYLLERLLFLPKLQNIFLLSFRKKTRIFVLG